MEAQLLLLDKAVVGLVLVSEVAEMNKAVLVIMELSEWQTSEQATEREIRKGRRTCCVVKWDLILRCVAHGRHLVTSVVMAVLITNTSEAVSLLGWGRHVC